MPLQRVSPLLSRKSERLRAGYDLYGQSLSLSPGSHRIRAPGDESAEWRERTRRFQQTQICLRISPPVPLLLQQEPERQQQVLAQQPEPLQAQRLPLRRP
ncbi:hypothetical protein D3C72_2013320 [compost metagenome]